MTFYFTKNVLDAVDKDDIHLGDLEDGAGRVDGFTTAPPSTAPAIYDFNNLELEFEEFQLEDRTVPQIDPFEES